MSDDDASRHDATTAYGRLLADFRHLQSALSSAAPPVAVIEALSGVFREAAAELSNWFVAEDLRYRQCDELGGQANPTLIPFAIAELTDTAVTVGVVFTDAHLGGNAAAHGGIVPLLFDDLMGKFTRLDDRELSRTAYLKVSYRNVTPLHKELQATVSIDRTEGRKMWLTGRLHDGDLLLADAEALFVTLRPGQR